MTLTTVDSGIRPGRRRIFMAVMVAVPILFFALTELFLRTFDYDGPLDVVVKRTVNGKEYYSINRAVGRKYFGSANVAIPEPSDDVFEIAKPGNTIRIFCLGESTMAGFPYEFNATAPRMLQDRLATLLPQYRIEVVNAGLAAVGSYVVGDIMKQLMPYQPDLFIVYLGHNEYYGIYQVASSLKGFAGRWATNLNIRLLRFRTYLLVRDLAGRVAGLLGSGHNSGGEILMEQMIGQQSIPFGSEVYEEGRAVYRKNITEMISVAQSAHIPIIFSALVSNERSQAPFQEIFSEKTPNDRREEYRRLIAQGDSLPGNNAAAGQLYSAAAAIDTINPTAYFHLARTLYASQRYSEARRAFEKARDLDPVRFRASTGIQQGLLETCHQLEVPVSRVDSSFESNSPNGIVGGELITEHVHPNIEGYFLMAKTWVNTIADAGLLAPPEAWDWKHDLSDSAYKELAPLTDFDRVVGQIKISLLLHRPPFVPQGEKFEFIPKDEVENIAYQYVRKQIIWSDARYQLAAFYARTKDFHRARAECRALSKVVPTAYQPVLQIADYFQLEGKIREAEETYFESIRREDNPFAHFKLAYLMLQEERAREAVENLEKGFELATTPRFTLQKDSENLARYLLAVGYAKLGKFDLALEHCQRILAVDPRNTETLNLMRQLEQLRSKQPSPKKQPS
ncbi:MAG: tetratricopeptide repeat protein [Bacteroidota bacterium]